MSSSITPLLELFCISDVAAICVRSVATEAGSASLAFGPGEFDIVSETSTMTDEREVTAAIITEVFGKLTRNPPLLVTSRPFLRDCLWLQSWARPPARSSTRACS